MMEEKLFELNDVHFAYQKRFTALKGISLEINRQEKVAILGANGTGKSTLLFILDGLLFPQKGSVTFLGRPMTEQSLQEESFHYFFRKRVGLVFQNPDSQLFSSHVWEDIAFGPLQLGKEKEEVEQIVRDALSMMGIEHLKDRSPFQLSYGEKKRVALSSVMAINPDVLLLDEPTAGLDPRSTRRLVDFLLEAHASGKTLITATNDLHLVAEMADKVCLLSEDKNMVFIGQAEEALSNAKLLDTFNLIHIHKHLHDSRWHRHPHRHYRAFKNSKRS